MVTSILKTSLFGLSLLISTQLNAHFVAPTGGVRAGDCYSYLCGQDQSGGLAYCLWCSKLGYCDQADKKLCDNGNPATNNDCNTCQNYFTNYCSKNFPQWKHCADAS